MGNDTRSNKIMYWGVQAKYKKEVLDERKDKKKANDTQSYKPKRSIKQKLEIEQGTLFKM